MAQADTTTTPDADGEEHPLGYEPGNARLDRWLQRTTTPLDALALCTIWLTMVPLGALHQVGASRAAWWYVARIGISAVYLVDILVRTALARRKLHYFVTHPVGVLSVVIPAIRLIFSLRLLRAMFRKGNLGHFLLVAVVLMANFTVIVYGFEHRDPSANITTLGTSIWWACVTVFTVGYGDYYPITFGGQLFAVLLMALGLVVAAVITAQIASTFMDQAAARRATAPDGTSTDEPSTDAPSTDAPPSSRVEEAMARIEATAQRMEDRLGQIERSVAGLSAPESPGSSAAGTPGT